MIWTWIKQAFSGFIQSIISFLPLSPFADIATEINNSLGVGWLNYFFPVGLCMHTMDAWTVAIGLYYAYTVIARWLKVIE